MRRVLHVLNSLERSGMEMMLLNSLPEWNRLGYECDVLATASTIGPLAPEMRERGYGVFHIPFRSKRRYLPNLPFIWDYFRLCRTGYDVVHIHTESGPPVFALLAKLAGVRRIAVTPHNTFIFTGALRFRKACERHFIRLLGGRVGMISEGVRKCEWERFRLRGIRIRNWLDTSHYRPPSIEERALAQQSLNIGQGTFVIVSVGNCNTAKNHEAILRALPLLPSGIRPLYLHIGREHQDLNEQRLASELKLDGRVRFLGSQPDPLPYLWAADVFAMPSLNEGLSIAAIEGIASGTSALFANVAGLSEIAAETTWTILTSPTPESVAVSLAEVAAIEPFVRRQRAMVDSQIVRERFSIRNGVRSIVEGLYTEREIGLQASDRVGEQP